MNFPKSNISLSCCVLRSLFFFGILTVIFPVVRGQGTIRFVESGGQAFVTATEHVFLPANVTSPMLTFEVGFTTDEGAVPNQTLDALTVSLQSPVTRQTAILMTADAAGTAWLPPPNGNLKLDPTALIFREVVFASVRKLANAKAYQVNVSIPSELGGESVDLLFDLFDNQDLPQSFGYFTAVTVVPEPSIGMMVALGGSLLLAGLRIFSR